MACVSSSVVESSASSSVADCSSGLSSTCSLGGSGFKSLNQNLGLSSPSSFSTLTSFFSPLFSRKTLVSPFDASQKHPAFHATVRGSGPQALSRPPIPQRRRWASFRPSFLWLPAWPCLARSWTAADHWLTFRGLPAEGLGALTREAASHPTTLASACGAPWPPQRAGLSAASGQTSNRRGAAREAAASCFAALPGRTTAANSPSRENPGKVFSVALWRTILVRSARLVSFAGRSASLHSIDRGVGTLLQSLGRGFSPPSRRCPRGPWSTFLPVLSLVFGHGSKMLTTSESIDQVI